MIGRRRVLGGLAEIEMAGAGIIGGMWRPAPTLVTSGCEGGPQLTDSIPVAYAIRTGSTTEVAEAIARPARPGVRLTAH